MQTQLTERQRIRAEREKRKAQDSALIVCCTSGAIMGAIAAIVYAIFLSSVPFELSNSFASYVGLSILVGLAVGIGVGGLSAAIVTAL